MRLIFLFSILLFAGTFFGQASFEKELAETGKKILAHPEYQERKKANQQFLEKLEAYVGTNKGYNDALASVGNMVRLEGKDELRVYTWQMPDSTYKYVRFGLVAAQTRRGIVVTRLEDATSQINQPEFKILKAQQWYGAIYYKLIPVKKGRRNVVYTLLGFAPGDDINQKIVDVIEVDGRGRPKFGARIFKIDHFMDKVLRKPPMRLILSYGGKYAASVRWNEDKEMIVMDHLSPPDDKLKGVYRMYGPDMSYDGLVWKDDWWHLENEVKFNSGQDVKIIPPDKPTDLPGSKPANGGPPDGGK
jgi:hypothetical protein